MPTVCIQCAMKAAVENQPSPVFEEEPEEHQRRVHPDLAATQKERAVLESQLAQKLGNGLRGGRL